MAAMPVKFADLESCIPSEEQAMLELFKRVEGIASEKELEQALYEFRGLLPALEAPRKIVDSYLALRQSDYYQTALSLVSFIVQSVHACRPDWLAKISEFIQEISTSYEADERIPSLMLRLTLAKITNQLICDDNQATNFMQLAADYLELHTDRFTDGPIPVLKLFDTLEERGSIGPKDMPLLVSEWLKNVGRNDLVREHIDNYNPLLPIRLTVLKEMKSNSSSNLAKYFLVFDVYING